jgi:hypothetical protein
VRIDGHSHYYPRPLDGRLDSAGPLVARTRGGFVRGFVELFGLGSYASSR